MSQVVKAGSLPSAMEAKLRSVRIRQAILVTIQAIALAASVLIAVMVVSMFVDWMLTLKSITARVFLTAATIAAAAGTLLLFAKPLTKALGWTQAAENVDEVVPQLEERWTTIANVASSPHAPTSPTGKAMLDQVTSEAVAIGSYVDPNRVAPPSKLKPSFLFLSACILLLGAFLATNWAQTSVLLKRFWSPTANITATQLQSASGDIQVPRGEPVDLIGNQSGLARGAAVLTMETDSGIVDKFELNPSEDQPHQFVHTVRADQPFRYQMVAGDGQTSWHNVSVIDYPAIGEVKFAVTAPAYIDRPKYEKPLIPSRLRVVQGSEFNLQIKPVAQLKSLTLALTIDEPEDGKNGKKAKPFSQKMELQRDDDGWYRFETQLMGNLSLKPLLVNSHGLTNEDQHTCHIQVIPDKAPVARVISRDDDVAVGIDDVIDVKMEAHDDHGIASAELVVYDETSTEEGEEPKILKTIPIPLGDQQYKKHVLANIKLDLSKLGVEEGASISYSVRVTDTRDLELDPEALSLMAKAKREASEKSKDAKGSKNDSQSETQSDFHNATDSKGNPDGGPQQSESIVDASDNKKSALDQVLPAMQIENDGSEDAKSSKGDQVAKSDSQSSSDKEKNGKNGEPSDSGQLAQSDSKSNDVADRDPKLGASSKLAMNDNASSKDAKKPGDRDADNSDKSRTKADSQDSKSDEMAKTLLAQNDTNNPSQNGTKSANDSKQTRSGEKSKPNNSSQANSKSDSPNEKSKSTSNPNSGSRNNAENAPSNVVRIADPSKDEKKRDSKGDAMPRQDLEARKDADPSQLASSDSPEREFRMSAQESSRPQNTMTTRRKLKIAKRLSAVAESDIVRDSNGEIRERVVVIDKMLAKSETDLKALVKREIRDADRTEQFRRLDKQLGDIEKYITDLRNETKEHQFAFVGLQMIDIARTNITPARDRVFTAIRDPKVADKNAQQGLQHVVRARELLAALLKRYDRVQGERKMKKKIDETIKMYEVYVERSQSLMRERQQNRNPLDRKMAIIEVDQEYLDRVAEVQRLRREMMRELGRLLGDDPRLLARYMDLIRRQRKSLRAQLADLAEQQDEVGMELSSWLAVDDDQRDDLWSVVAEIRLQSVAQLAKDAAEVAERLRKNLPLTLDPKIGASKTMLEHASEAARLARQISFAVDDFFDSGDGLADLKVLPNSDALVAELSELMAALDQLRFENEADEQVTTYVDGRFLETRTVADQADVWLNMVRFLKSKKYHELALIEQQRVSIETELLRAQMLNMENDVRNQFLRAQINSVPGPILDLIRELQQTMHEVTMNQAATGFTLSRVKLELAEARQANVLEGFDRAEKLFDKMRRAIVDALDEYDPPDPNIADLRDPTLDEFLARLEREPNIEAQLGIPRRRRNLRVIADSLLWQQNGSGLLGASGEAAARRMNQAMKMKRNRGGKRPPKEMTNEERAKSKKAEEMQKELEESLVKLREKAEDPKLSEQQRRQMQQAAKKLQRTIDQMNEDDEDGSRWQQLVAQGEAKALLRALAAGEKVPDEQWNRLISKLGDGLWQVGGTTPPEEYRKSIEQYQSRLRELMNTIDEGV